MPPTVDTIEGLVQEPDLREKDGYTYAEGQTEFVRLQVLSRQQYESQPQPRFGFYPVLQQINLLHLEKNLAKFYGMFKDRRLEEDDLPNLHRDLKEYCQALKDFDYVLQMKEPNALIQKQEYRNRVRQLYDYPRGFSKNYRTFTAPASLDSDFLTRFISDHLPPWAAWSNNEKNTRSDEYATGGAKPLEYSTETRILASVIITLLAASWLIVPIVIMTIPGSASVAWNLTTMAIAIVLFGGFVAVVVGPNSSTKDVITATAAYAAVLVVFYGNITNST
ncbi:hypothetical protein EDB81DRAFT_857510 [Dactylonectria macrodidyma]|uniref:DUF6594 domain-containing protein n=1 Tax=Dactylonectria macrodidyma TaxID=307937 RepID=A0A9P9EPP0_9HYPO|nr:hypothetical protein EDB81DRAFT_857510 [Dactylonectria macrodidyma]